MPVKPIREGFHAITPYLFARNASQLIDFICAGLGGELVFRKARPDGTIMHAELRVGDSMLMVAEPTEQFGPNPTSIYSLRD
jgi:PhnB protein